MIMALYLRLSKEDGDMIDESNSITNQRYILRRFVEQRPEFDSYEIKEYIDDGLLLSITVLTAKIMSG